MKFLKLFISVVAVLLLALVGIGLALPGTWEARRSTVVPGDADAVFDYLDSVEGWAAWTPFAAVEGVRSGPDRGAGATLRWDDPQWGQGEWVLTEVERPRAVAYEVRVEDGALVTRGRVGLADTGTGPRLDWRGSGECGWTR
ncbi:MAG: SRPBCC family protein, partial [Longimicrobiales bacterium]